MLLLLAALSGCGPRPLTRYELSGAISYAGAPLPAGYIVMAPAETSTTGGPASQADIHDGQYRVPQERGVVGGPYVFTVYGFDGVRSEESGLVNALGKPLFAGYRVEVNLPTAPSVRDLDIPAAWSAGR